MNNFTFTGFLAVAYLIVGGLITAISIKIMVVNFSLAMLVYSVIGILMIDLADFLFELDVKGI